MSIQGAMQAGVSGLNSQARKFAMISDNVSNSQTVGYKRTTADFITQVIDSASKSTYAAGGVSTSVVRQIERAGTVQGSESGTDMSINGGGFFLVKGGLPAAQAGSSPLLTRVGASYIDSEGYFRLRNGYYLQGMTTDTTGTVTTNTMAPVLLDQSPSVPVTSSAVTFRGNLPADLAASTTQGSPLVTTMNYVDELGSLRGLTFSFTPSMAGTPNDWGITITDEAGASYTDTFSFNAVTGAGGTGGYPNSAETPTFTFPSSAAPLDLPAGKGQTMQITLDLTQFDYDYNPTFSTDGVPVSDFNNVEIADDGVVYSVYKDGSRRPQYRLAMGDVINPAGLKPEASNAYSTTLDSGDLIPRFAGEGSVGTIQDFTLEGSNVDIAEELTQMITTQRSYTANASIITTADEMLQEAVRLKR